MLKAENCQTEDQISEIKLAFDVFDKGQGTISTQDMRTAIKALGQAPPEIEMERIAREVDRQGGQVNQSHFLTIMGNLIGEGDSEADLVAAFQIFDKQNTGYISIEDFKHAMSNLGDTLPSREVDEMLQVGGVTNGWLDYRTWVQNMLAS